MDLSKNSVLNSLDYNQKITLLKSPLIHGKGKVMGSCPIGGSIIHFSFEIILSSTSKSFILSSFLLVMMSSTLFLIQSFISIKKSSVISEDFYDNSWTFLSMDSIICQRNSLIIILLVSLIFFHWLFLILLASRDILIFLYASILSLLSGFVFWSVWSMSLSILSHCALYESII